MPVDGDGDPHLSNEGFDSCVVHFAPKPQPSTDPKSLAHSCAGGVLHTDGTGYLPPQRASSTLLPLLAELLTPKVCDQGVPRLTMSNCST